MKEVIWIGGFGAIGALLRHGITVLSFRVFQTPTAIATGVTNIMGCLAFGFLYGVLLRNSVVLPVWIRPGLTVGLLGSFTTFSTFTFESWSLLHSGRYGFFLLNMVANLGLGLLAFVIGMYLIK